MPELGHGSHLASNTHVGMRHEVVQVVEWNCNMAFRKKTASMLALIAAGVGLFVGQGVGQINVSVTTFQVVVVEGFGIA
jgi:hypothetical protein